MFVERQQNSASSSSAEPIAIVGVGCKLPGNITTVEVLLAALRDGRDCITEIPPERWDLDAFYDPDPVTPGKSYVRHGGFVADVDRFDPAFFGISDSEAARMDPQQRLVLETVWHALEHAGQSPDELVKSNTGVFVAMMNTNAYSHLKAIYEGIHGVTGYDAMADAMSITAGRISHFFGLEGPCFALDTACSGSMVAVHQARQSILAGDCDAAIVVGINLILHPGIHVAFSKLQLMSRAGRCAAFDESGDGYIRGEGCVAMLLRRQSEAIARNDHILASILGSAITQDGRTPAITAPNGQAQEKVIRMALARVGISPNEIDYVEAHGTGTPVGDPIEMSALVNVYGPGRALDHTLFVGSAKTNFGHLESAAGLVGLAKAALSLDQEVIFPSLHFKRLNPNINLGQAPMQVPTTTIPWPRGERRRMAGVNSFGYSGTNTHAILQEAPLPASVAAEAARSCEIVVLSAKSQPSLQELADKWTAFLDQEGGPRLADIAFTAATGRSHLRNRLAVVVHSRDELSDKLYSWREGRMAKGVAAGQTAIGRRVKIGFVFTGQGAQYAGMGRRLYESEPRFKAAIDRCASVMDAELGAPLTEILFGADGAKLLGNTRYVQPALFAIEYALADLLHHWGIEPSYVIGHSVGEIVAATVAGVLTLEDAARFVMARGRLMGALPPGGKMLAVDATPEQARDWLAGNEDEASIAGVNGPRSVVVSGTAAAVDHVARLAAAAGHRAKALEVSHAFHSPLMDPILPELERVAANLRISAATIPVISNVTGDVLGDDIAARYWSQHVRQPVLFHEGMAKIIEAGCSVLVEIGPHPALTTAITAAFDMKKTRCVATLIREQDDVARILETLAALYVAGAPANLDRVFWSADYRRVSLPLYPFRRDKHWLREELGLQGEQEIKTAPARQVHPVLGRVVSIGSRRALFETSLSATQPWVDHRIMGSTVFPGTAYLEMAARGFAVSKDADWQSLVLRDVLFERPIVLAYRKTKKLNLTVETRAANGVTGEATFVVSAAGEGATENHCRGRIVTAGEQPEQFSVQIELGRMKSKLNVGQFYGELRNAGFEYGASFSTIRELWLGEPGSGEAIARVTASANPDMPEDHPYRHSTVLDGCLQVTRAALLTVGEAEICGTFVPKSIKSVAMARELPSQAWCHVTVRTNEADRSVLASMRVISDAGDVLVHLVDLDMRQIARLSLARGDGAPAASERTFASREELVASLTKLPARERVGVVSKWLVAEIKDILGQAAEDIDLDNLDPSTAFVEIGLDSLLVTELQRRIQEKLEFRFKPMQGLDYQSIETLAEYLLKEVLFAEPASAAPPAAAATAAAPSAAAPSAAAPSAAVPSAAVAAADAVTTLSAQPAAN
jgi:acyl transferase domain-containing protein